MTREVLEYIIVPPYERASEVAASAERLKDHLSRKFPGYSFKVSGFVPVGDEDEFCVVPVMNYLSPEGRSLMCEQPSRWFMADIAQACKNFDFTGSRCAA
ncbi:hypothetical protein [Brucella anthropi]|uniref:hypothetical protein n=1 Tax=Brucella anthropi TaxID=529 RepID=UPI003D996E12